MTFLASTVSLSLLFCMSENHAFVAAQTALRPVYAPDIKPRIMDGFQARGEMLKSLEGPENLEILMREGRKGMGKKTTPGGSSA